MKNMFGLDIVQKYANQAATDEARELDEWIGNRLREYSPKTYWLLRHLPKRMAGWYALLVGVEITINRRPYAEGSFAEILWLSVHGQLLGSISKVREFKT